MREGVPINGRVLTELRHLAGMEQIDLANAACVHTPGCKVAPNKISDYEREVIKPSAANLNAILKALKIALEARGLELTPAMLRALYRTDTLNASNGSTGKEDEADRRQAGKTILVGGLTAAAFPLEAVERITHHGDRPVDSKLITAHEDIADTLASLFRSVPPDELRDLVVHHAHKLLKLLDRPLALTDRRRLEVTAVGSYAQAGLLFHASADRPTARHCVSVARSVADDAGDDTLLAQALTVTTILHSSIPQGRGGDTPRAVKLLEAAGDHSRHADAPTRALVHHWLAEELAVAGDERGFRQAMSVAERVYEQSGQQDARGFFACHYAVIPEDLSLSRGIGLVRIGRADEAIDALEAIRISVPPRHRMLVLAEVAAARAIQGEPEEACATLVRALDLTLEAGYAMGIERILGVRARFPAAWAGLPCVAQLDERLRLT